VTPLKTWDAIIVGGGLAGLSAAVYLGRAQRATLVIDSGKSMAQWEPKVQNYLGFPGGISGEELLQRGRQQAERSGARFVSDEILRAGKRKHFFNLRGRRQSYRAKSVLLATGIFHIPPDINGVRACLGHSMFFCKDCDGVRVRGKRVAIYGSNNEAADYALGMLLYEARVAIVTDGRAPRWNRTHARWIREYRIPVFPRQIERVSCQGCQVRCLKFGDGTELPVEAIFTTRGDVYYNQLARMLGARIAGGEVLVDRCLRTSVKGLYAAGCVTPANCQMIIAAGQGAAAAQAINRTLFNESLANHTLLAGAPSTLRKRPGTKARKAR
jgi:thioredoxin reductase (NADPH)